LFFVCPQPPPLPPNRLILFSLPFRAFKGPTMKNRSLLPSPPPRRGTAFPWLGAEPGGGTPTFKQPPPLKKSPERRLPYPATIPATRPKGDLRPRFEKVRRFAYTLKMNSDTRFSLAGIARDALRFPTFTKPATKTGKPRNGQDKPSDGTGDRFRLRVKESDPEKGR